MEQRRLRLGDILDDYCPRERRVTNHAIVAMIEEEIKQTRCTTCDAEHAYKRARLPRRRKKESDVPASAPAAALEPVQGAILAERHPEPPVEPSDAIEPDVQADVMDVEPVPAPLAAAVLPSAEPETLAEEPVLAEPAAVVDGPVHRPLIRATLPRPEGQKDARPVPDFTVRHSPTRGGGHGSGGSFRDRMRTRGNGNGQGANGNRAYGAPRFHGGSGNRASGGRQPMGRGGAPGFRNGNSGPNGKRGRGPR